MPVFLQAQRPEWDAAFDKSIAGFGTRLSMPLIDNNPAFILEEQFTPRKRQMFYRIYSDSIYQKIFYRHIYNNDSVAAYQKRGADSLTLSFIKKYHIDSLPKIDFAVKTLLVYMACGQCLANCNHQKEEQSCHRNACDYHYARFVRQKPIPLRWD